MDTPTDCSQRAHERNRLEPSRATEALSLFDWAAERLGAERAETAPQAVAQKPSATVYTLYPQGAPSLERVQGSARPLPAAVSEPGKGEANEAQDLPRSLHDLFSDEEIAAAEDAASDLRRTLDRMGRFADHAANDAERLLNGLAVMLAFERDRLEEAAAELEPPLCFETFAARRQPLSL